MEIQTVVTILQGNPSIIPDVIPDVKKPLDPPIWFEEYDEEDTIIHELLHAKYSKISEKKLKEKIKRLLKTKYAD
jgi:hypothetical protein